MTANHISDELPRLLTGEAPRDVVLTAAEHLRECADCQQELVSAVVAHASLTSAQRFAPEVATTTRTAPPTPEPQPLPNLDAVFRQVRAEAASGDGAAPQRRRWVLVGAAAAAVVVGGGIAIGVATSGPSGPSTQTVALQSVGTWHGRPTVTMVGTGRMKVDATSLPRLTSGNRYEVWLTSPHGPLQPVGFVGNNRTADLTLPSDLIAQYREVAISEQHRDQTQFSGVVVARGNYA
jgi:anti-sigma-K factor RskA